MVGNFKPFNGMCCQRKLGEVVSADRAPVAVSIRPSKVFRHIRQHTTVVFAALRIEHVNVVLNRGGYEIIIVGILASFGVIRVNLELPIYKQPLNPSVPHSSGIACKVHSLGNIVRTTKTAAEELKRSLRELCRLIKENPVVLNTVVFLLALVALPMSELNRRPVIKLHNVAGAVPRI